MKILLLEDDKLYNETLTEFLEDEGFSIDSVLDPYGAYDLAYNNTYDLYIFDINLPFESGIKALKALRDSGDKTPTIFVTSSDDKETLIKSFKVGADDFLRKPIDLDEMLARINAVTKRFKRNNIIRIGEYILNKDKLDVFYKNKSLNFTNKQFKLLEILVENKERVVRYEEIYEYLWQGDGNYYSSLRVYISLLKKYFNDNIKSVRGVGYIFKDIE